MQEVNIEQESSTMQKHGNCFISILYFCLHFVRNMKTEPVMFFFCLGYHTVPTFVQNLMLEKVCTDLYPQEICNNISGSVEKEDQVQARAASYILYYNLVLKIPSIILSIFLGSWSDLHGRKLAIVMSMTGNCITYFLYMLIYWNASWPATSIIYAAIPSALTGGYTVFMMSFYGFLRDVHELKELPVKISIADGIETLCIQIASLVGAQLYQYLGYNAIFSMSIASMLIGIGFSIVNVTDVKYPKTDWSILFKDFFRVGTLLDNFRVLYKKRKQHKQLYVILLCIIIFLSSFASSGADENFFLYLKLRLSWDIVLYSYYNLASSGWTLISFVVVAPILINYFKFSSMSIALTGHIPQVFQYIGIAFATTTVAMFAVSSISVLSTLMLITYRAAIAQCISHNEMGKLMALTAIIQTVGGNIGSIISTKIYIATLQTSPMAIYLCSAGIVTIIVIIFMWMTYDAKRLNVNFYEEDDDVDDHV